MRRGATSGPGGPPVHHGAGRGWRRSPLLALESMPTLHRMALWGSAVAFLLTIIGTEMARHGGGPVPALLISTAAGAVGLLAVLALLVLVAGELHGGPHPPADAVVVVGPEPDPGQASVLFRRRARLWTDGTTLGFVGAERVEHRWPLDGPDALTHIETMALPVGAGHVLRLRSANGRILGHLRSAQWFPRAWDPTASAPLCDLAAAAGLAVRAVPSRSSEDPAVTLDHHLGPAATPIVPWTSMAMFDLAAGAFLAIVASLMLPDAAWAPLSLALGVLTAGLSVVALVVMGRIYSLSVRGRHGA